MTTSKHSTPASVESPEKRLVWLLGPAFVAAIAYVDPGNVAANLSAGAEYGYLLVWVLVVANVMAWGRPLSQASPPAVQQSQGTPPAAAFG